jgi:hypothetical protein
VSNQQQQPQQPQQPSPPPTLSSYMRRAIDSRFPQYELLDTDSFLKLLKAFAIKFNGGDFNPGLLEYYDRHDVIKPIMRIDRRLSNNEPNRRHIPLILDNYLIRDDYLPNGLVQFPDEEGEFRDWSNYRDGPEKRTFIYYHPAQVMAFQALTLRSADVSPLDIEIIQDPRAFVERWRERLTNEIQISRNVYRRDWIRSIGLLILLEEAYSPLVRNFRDRSPSHNGSLFKEWTRWRVREFSAQDVLDASGMTIEKIRGFYQTLVFFLAFKHDPLELWIVLQHYIKDLHLDRLHQQAARAQEYYKLARMVKRFIYDLTEEIMPGPDEFDERTRKERFYNVKKFKYSKVKHRRKILNDFLENQLSQMTVAVEGDTEEYVISAILKARNVELEREGLDIYNAVGNNMNKDLEGYLKAAKKNHINVFVIVDRDKKSFIDRLYKKKILTKNRVCIWKDDFEHDNFEIKPVLDIINGALRKRSLSLIKEEDVTNTMKNDEVCFMNALERVYGITNRRDRRELFSSIIHKKEIAKSLMRERIKEIKIEYEAGEWETDKPIEKVIHRILTELMPPRSY